MVVLSICPLNCDHSLRGHQRMLGGDVVHVHRPPDHLHEQQERHDEHLERHPERTEHSIGERAEGGGATEGEQQHRAEHQLVAHDGVVALAGCVEAPHLLPPHGAQEMAPNRTATTDTMTGRAKRPMAAYSHRGRMPHE
jgi:hypothetical protein